MFRFILGLFGIDHIGVNNNDHLNQSAHILFLHFLRVSLSEGFPRIYPLLMNNVHYFEITLILSSLIRIREIRNKCNFFVHSFLSRLLQHLLQSFFSILFSYSYIFSVNNDLFMTCVIYDLLYSLLSLVSYAS